MYIYIGIAAAVAWLVSIGLFVTLSKTNNELEFYKNVFGSYLPDYKSLLKDYTELLTEHRKTSMEIDFLERQVKELEENG